MAEHPIVPIQQDQIPSSDLHPQTSLILNVKTQTIEFNFFKGVDHEMMGDIVGKLLHEND